MTVLLWLSLRRKCRKSLYNRCTPSVQWIRKLSRVQLYLIEAEVFIKRSDEVFMKQVAAAGRALCRTRARRTVLFLYLHRFYVNNLSTHPLRGVTWTEFAVKAVASVVLFSSRQKMWPCENGAQCLEVMTCCTTLLVICAPCRGRRGDWAIGAPTLSIRSQNGDKLIAV